MAAKNPAAAALGRLGGLARAATLSEERRSEIARQGGQRKAELRPKTHEVVTKMLEAIATTQKKHVLFVERGVCKFAEADTPIADLWMVEADTCVGTYGVGAKFTDVLNDYLAT